MVYCLYRDAVYEVLVWFGNNLYVITNYMCTFILQILQIIIDYASLKCQEIFQEAEYTQVVV